jgi:hypothetical protein
MMMGTQQVRDGGFLFDHEDALAHRERYRSRRKGA